MKQHLSLILLVVFNVVGTLAGATICFMALNEPIKPPPVVDPYKDLSAAEYLKQFNIFADKPILFSMDAFTVNLSNQEEDKVVQVEVNFEMLDEKSFQEVTHKSAEVRDTIVKILAEKSSRDIASIQGKLYLKDDIASAVNRQLGYGYVKGVYFTRFYIQ